LQEDTLFVTTSNIPLSLGQWKVLILIPLRGLIQFATKNGGTINRAAARPNDPKRRWIDHYGLDVRLPWTADWMTQYPYDDSHFGLKRPLFYASDFVDSPSALSAWLELFGDRREALTSVLDLSLGAPSAEFRFFAAARLLERLAEKLPLSSLGATLHHKKSDRWKRLVSLLEAWQEHVEPTRSHPEMLMWVATLIIDTRNCFAHQSPSTCRKAATGYRLLCLEALVRTLIDSQICRKIGLPAETAVSALTDSKQYRLGQELVNYFTDEQAIQE